jgi:hypothetical protein
MRDERCGDDGHVVAEVLAVQLVGDPLRPTGVVLDGCKTPTAPGRRWVRRRASKTCSLHCPARQPGRSLTMTSLQTSTRPSGRIAPAPHEMRGCTIEASTPAASSRDVQPTSSQRRRSRAVTTDPSCHAGSLATGPDRSRPGRGTCRPSSRSPEGGVERRRLNSLVEGKARGRDQGADCVGRQR